MQQQPYTGVVVDAVTDQGPDGVVVQYRPARPVYITTYPHPSASVRLRRRIRLVPVLVAAWLVVVGLVAAAAVSSAGAIAGPPALVVALAVLVVLARRRRRCPGVVVHCHK